MDIANDQALIFNLLNTIDGDRTKRGEADNVLEIVLEIVQVCVVSNVCSAPSLASQRENRLSDIGNILQHPAAHRILLDLGAITFFRTMRQDAAASSSTSLLLSEIMQKLLNTPVLKPKPTFTMGSRATSPMRSASPIRQGSRRTSPMRSRATSRNTAWTYRLTSPRRILVGECYKTWLGSGSEVVILQDAPEQPGIALI